MTLATLMADTLAALEAAGVRATDDARNVNPPCALVGWPAGEYVAGRGRVHVTMTAYLVVGDSGASNAAAAMSALLGRVDGLFSLATFRPAGLQLPGGGDPLPALELTWSTSTPTT